MALDKDRLGNALADAVIAAAGIAPGSADEIKLRDMWKDLADEIIKEFKNNAQISSTGATLAHVAGQPASIVSLPGVILQ